MVKTAAVLCSGPSLRETWTDASASCYDIVIAVNHACEVASQYHWAAVGDNCWLDRIAIRPSIGLCSMDGGIDLYLDGGTPIATGLRVCRWSELPWRLNGGRHLTWTSQTALLLAEREGCVAADCYGMDLAGALHCVDGHADKRGDARWHKERACMYDLRAQQAARGFQWRRICRDGPRHDLSPDTQVADA